MKTKLCSRLKFSNLSDDDVQEIWRITALKARAMAEVRRLRVRIDAIERELKTVTENKMAEHYGADLRTIRRAVEEYHWRRVNNAYRDQRVGQRRRQ